MLICIEREPREPNTDSIFGALSIEGEKCLVTMEPAPREDRVFIPGDTALPPDTYNLSVDYCRRFRRNLPLLVAMFQDRERRAAHVRLGMWIHPGNKVHESTTEIVVAKRRMGRTVLETVEGFVLLMRVIEDARTMQEAIEVEIRGMA